MSIMTRRIFLQSLASIGVNVAIAPKLLIAEDVINNNNAIEFQPSDGWNDLTPIGYIMYYKNSQFQHGRNELFTYIIKGDYCWYKCNGQRVLKVENPKLYEALQDKYGKPGLVSFVLPDFLNTNIATGRRL